jgi:membrane associated rhomboid family serine protease
VGGMIPFGDASRRPRRSPVVTTAIIVANALVFVLELMGGDAFVQQWSVIPADIVAGQHWFLWAFGPEVEGAMGRLRYLAFYLLESFRRIPELET